MNKSILQILLNCRTTLNVLEQRYLNNCPLGDLETCLEYLDSLTADLKYSLVSQNETDMSQNETYSQKKVSKKI